MAEDKNASSVVKARADDARSYWLDEGRAPGGFIREVDFAANSRGVDPLFEGIKIVDCDTHFTEPKDLWTANAPAGLKSKMPHVRRIDGADQWFVGDKLLRARFDYRGHCRGGVGQFPLQPGLPCGCPAHAARRSALGAGAYLRRPGALAPQINARQLAAAGAARRL